MLFLITVQSYAAASAQGLEAVKAAYTKYEYRIPMRDGVKLFTAVYVPKDRTKTYPILLTRTPYSVAPYGSDNYRSDLGPSPLFGRSSYIIAYQDVRGRWMSEGRFDHMRPIVAHEGSTSAIDESIDTFDTIDWLVKNIPGNTGKVGIWGISYPGFYAAAGSVDAHPALVASSPQAPVIDWFVGDDWHHNGALMLPHAFNFMVNFERIKGGTGELPPPVLPFDYGTVDGYKFYLGLGSVANADARHFHGTVPFWSEIMRHGNYDSFWKSRNLRPHLKAVKPAVMTVGGWYDAENLFGALEAYKQIERSTPGANNMLVMGPWSHGGWARGDGDSLGPLSFASKTSATYREQIEFPFFEHHLKGGSDPGLPEAFIFETGTNEWKRFTEWPPRSTARSLHLAESGALHFDPPETTSDEAFDEYTSDPAHPVPHLEDIAIGMTGDYMTQDQRFASRRPDVLTYETRPLQADLTIAGPIGIDFVVSTTGTDADFIVKLIDVFPESYPRRGEANDGPVMPGFQHMVRGDVMRGKFRNSLESPEPFSPGTPTRLAFTMLDAAHTFRVGHRIMVQVQSSWFPLVDRNPQKFLDIYNARDDDFQKAAQRVYRSKSRPSRVVLPVLP
jgi:putative CocE/NonD family hydrolase